MLAPTDTDEGRLRRKRLGKKEKLRLNHNVEPAAATRVPPVDDTPVVVNFAQEVVAPYAGWSWMPLVDATPITLPVVFSQDQKLVTLALSSGHDLASDSDGRVQVLICACGIHCQDLLGRNRATLVDSLYSSRNRTLIQRVHPSYPCLLLPCKPFESTPVARRFARRHVANLGL